MCSIELIFFNIRGCFCSNTYIFLFSMMKRMILDGYIQYIKTSCILGDQKCCLCLFSGYVDEMDMNQSIRKNLRHLPDDNLIVLSYLIHFLSRVAAHSNSNQMPVENLATIFGPCIFR